MEASKTFTFISKVQEYPPLWQKSNKDFMNRDVKKQMFKELASHMSMTGKKNVFNFRLKYMYLNLLMTILYYLRINNHNSEGWIDTVIAQCSKITRN